MEKSNNYEMFFYEGTCFLIASWAIFRKYADFMTIPPTKMQSQAIGIYWASHVNHAYALEMFIKSLSIIERGGYSRGHKLKEMFSELKDETQDSIISAFNLSTSNTVDFRESLGEFERPFVHFRYWAEHKKYLSEYKLDAHAEVVRNYIRKLKPELPDTF